ncbi:hypothetical protein D081_2060 [Anaerovibrio sp. JC8]|uniref:ribbon-helix-helix domain-containing protein n=1 Tax=Anaerovibrio sp. JC8 TaxID=1240085 RepID=UPI000A0B6EDB|nr:ribbon-helix-helix domain-containing protein [Anaerovibrio sp. JC8]ORT99331.1 hypothetical protein D081_2060 [Anaerovibrio sp. JC8]
MAKKLDLNNTAAALGDFTGRAKPMVPVQQEEVKAEQGSVTETAAVGSASQENVSDTNSMEAVAAPKRRGRPTKAIKKDSRLSVYMTEELKGRLEALADKKNMSMNTIITAALMDYCESNGM